MPVISIDIVRERARTWRREIVQARIRLADDGLTAAERAGLWRIVDRREWRLKMLAENFAEELEEIDRDIERELRR